MGFSKFSHLSQDEVLEKLSSGFPEGLSDSQVKQKQNEYGLNEIKDTATPWWKIFLRQSKSSFIYLLFAAGILSFLLGERVDATLIFLFIFINASIGFIQEYRSETAVQSLKKFTEGRAKVRRESKESLILSSDLVPGDVVILETGDIVPADIRLLDVSHFLVDETILTGESIQVTKKSQKLDQPISEPYKAENVVFKGTSILNGKAEGVVIATGRETEIGKISKFITETKRESAFQKNIDRISKFIIWLVIVTIFVVLGIHYFIDDSTRSFIDLIVFSIALTVGVIPEALPLVTTFSLSKGAKILAEQNVVVKRLTSVEDLGSIQVLCTDKTGTITENKLSVSDTYVINSDFGSLAFSGSIAIRDIYGKEVQPNNAFDLALIAALDEEEKNQLNAFHFINEIPFDPSRRRSSVLVEKDENQFLIVRGSPEEMILLDPSFSEDDRLSILQWLQQQGKLGRRTLAISMKKWEKGGEEYSVEDEETNIKISGIVSFSDQLKPTTRSVVEQANELGVRLVVLTGDDPIVAGAVAYDANITDNRENVITGENFDKLSLGEKRVELSRTNVYARVSPKQKYEIIQLLQEEYLVGFLGEGINDAPALKAANVSLVVESASDIAREASDIILLKSDLGTIIDGVIQGRKTFYNSLTYIRATLLSNFGNFFAVAFASLIIPYLPMLPVQLLLVNLLSDFPMFSISTDNVGKEELLRPKQYDSRDIIVIASILGVISTLFDFAMFGIFQRLGEAQLQTYWFIGSILSELVLLFSIRTKKIFFKASTRPSNTIIILSSFAFVTTIALPFTSIGQSWFHFAHPTWSNIGIILIVVLLDFIVTEIVKVVYFKYIDKD
ncbi:MAG: HAD-IC family P-type ATPase [Brevefilum sp.]|nr:HAD-IC family P-type ATPase [Brevefilum sp.]MDT8380902.1 HAD-IC family P-type ATPase [Brevefilum sp.]MDW7754218.1 HAD-IC family P-type ATPase [Brevefilum sp.]